MCIQEINNIPTKIVFLNPNFKAIFTPKEDTLLI